MKWKENPVKEKGGEGRVNLEENEIQLAKTPYPERRGYLREH